MKLMTTAYVTAAMAMAVLSGCASHTAAPAAATPATSGASAYVTKPDYDHAMVCDTRYDDLKKCEATLKTLCGERGFIDLRIRPLRDPGADVDSTYRLLQLQCKARPAG